MSKLPFASSGGAWKPPKLRVTSTMPGSQEEAALAAAYAPQLKQFYLGSRQAHLLGVTDQSAYRRELPFGRLRYMVNQGQEIVTLDLHPEAGEPPPPVLPRKPWDWAVVEIEVPNRFGGTADATRVRPGPPYEIFTQIAPYMDELDPHVIAWANRDLPYTDMSDEPETTFASLRVDLRRHQLKGQIVLVDIQAKLLHGYTFGLAGWHREPEIATYGSIASTSLGTYDTTVSPFGAQLWPFTGNEHQYPTGPGSIYDTYDVLLDDAPLTAPVPNITTDMIDPLYDHYEAPVLHPASGIPQSVVRHYGQATQVAGNIWELTQYTQTQTFHPVIDVEGAIPDHVEVPCPVRFTVGLGNPPEQQLRMNRSSVGFWRWSMDAEAGHRFEGGKFRDVMLSSREYRPVGRLLVHSYENAIALSRST